MSLNIKNSEAYNLAREIAQLTGRSMTSIVIDALRQQLKYFQLQQQKEKRVRELMTIGQGCAAHLKQVPAAQDHRDLFYDEDGLPQ